MLELELPLHADVRQDQVARVAQDLLIAQPIGDRDGSFHCH